MIDEKETYKQISDNLEDTCVELQAIISYLKETASAKLKGKVKTDIMGRLIRAEKNAHDSLSRINKSRSLICDLEILKHKNGSSNSRRGTRRKRSRDVS